jgi:hypothetical protein
MKDAEREVVGPRLGKRAPSQKARTALSSHQYQDEKL